MDFRNQELGKYRGHQLPFQGGAPMQKNQKMVSLLKHSMAKCGNAALAREFCQRSPF